MNEIDLADPKYLQGIADERQRIIDEIRKMPDDIRIYKYALMLALGFPHK